MILKPHNSITATALRYFIYSLTMGCLVCLVTWEAQHHIGENLFEENSILESLQAGLLLLTAASAFLAGYIDDSRESLAAVLLGAATIASIREFDFALDRFVFDGAWQCLALGVALLTAIRVFRHRQAFKTATLDFLERPCFGLMAGGFITVFVFSRLIGRQILWRAVMGDHYMRAVKSAAEENCELLGYALILFGAFEFLHDTLVAREAKHPAASPSSLGALRLEEETRPAMQAHDPFHPHTP
ncbi:hypothetical protein [Desulfoluna sp.]|uniref:hypothetical protein n=1 Tax=Desulfoluna sp. TaxID=2045199 RepID=UPI002629AEF8|nr:hypothetical protein [Desulfoluna sp.]